MVEQLCVRVTNHNAFENPIVDAHDGVEYTFPQGRPVTIPLPAAEHIFGFKDGAADFIHVQRRFGWNVKGQSLEHAREWFNNLVVEPIVMRQFEIPPSVSEKDLEEAIQIATIREPPLDVGTRRVHE
jgi:hypothetical protein